MGPPLLFIRTTPLPQRSRLPARCQRRPRLKPFMLSAPEDDPSSSADPSWTELARALNPTSPDDAPPVRAPPVWQLPDDAPPAPDAASSLWAAWDSARVADDTDAPARDPKAETDFWRDAARDLTPDGLLSEPAEKDTAPPQTGLWGQARSVTGEVSQVQERLRDELERFNLDETRDAYRDIARELVGPPEDEPWDDLQPTRGDPHSDDAAALAEAAAARGELDPEPEAGSGWNPDVDWKRFDDVRREQAGKMQKEARAAVEQDALSKRGEGFDRESEGASGSGAGNTGPPGKIQDVTYTDESGRELTADEVQKAIEEGAIFVDDSGAELESSTLGDAARTPPPPNSSGKLPGFVANRMRSSGSYGSSWPDAESELQALRESGVPMRDPKAETDAWRSAARELNIEVESEVEVDGVWEGDGERNEEVEGDCVVTDEGSGELEDGVVLGAEVLGMESVEGMTPGLQDASSVPDVSIRSEESVGDSENEASLWSSWRSGTANWEDAVNKAPPRDPKKEVDIWRSSARELSSNTAPSVTSPASNTSDDEIRSEDTNAWEQWRSANSQWQSSVDEAAQDPAINQTSSSPWSTGSDSSDWSSGLDSKTSSDRSAWQAWNVVGGQDFGSSRASWWESRSDLPTKSFSNAKQDNVDEWRQIAREATGAEAAPLREGICEEGTQERVKGTGAAIDFWRKTANDITPGQSDSDKETEENDA